MTTTPTIQTNFHSSDLSVVELLDPVQIKIYRDSLATQINASRMAQANPKQIIDLSDYIADVVIETTVQGASILEVHVIDPGWIMLRRDSNGVSFFDTDQQGYLWPPIDVNFPQGESDALWTLCQLRPSTELTEANLVLAFEDKSVSVLREFQGPVLSNPGETRAEFIHRLVKEAIKGTPMPTIKGFYTTNAAGQLIDSAPVVGMPDGSIRFVALLPHLDFTAADLATDQQFLPTSAKQKNVSVARSNPNKKATGKNVLIHGDAFGSSSFNAALNQTALSIADGMQVDINGMTTGWPYPANLTVPPATTGSGGSFG